MKFAHFAHVWGKTGMTPPQRYEQLWRELQLGDELGFDYGFSVEHHFRPDESWMSSPNLYAVAAGARTKRIRLGAMGHVVPLHHPLRLVEEIALADQISAGASRSGWCRASRRSISRRSASTSRRAARSRWSSCASSRRAYTDGGDVRFRRQAHQVMTDMKLSVPPGAAAAPADVDGDARPARPWSSAREKGINTGYFLLFPRAEAKPRYRSTWGMEGGGLAGHAQHRLFDVVYVDKTDKKALDTALADAGRAYKGFFPLSDDPVEMRASRSGAADLFETARRARRGRDHPRTCSIPIICWRTT